jgi:hypothetical protein
MDSWMGNNSDPQSLHKYTYANVDPVNNTDPTGHFTLVGMAVAQDIDIQTTLGNLQADVGFSLLDATFDPEDAADGTNVTMGLGIVIRGHSPFNRC